MLDKKSEYEILKHFGYFSQKKALTCHANYLLRNLISGKNKKNIINLSSAGPAERVVKFNRLRFCGRT